MFEKGDQRINREGRPKGSKDKAHLTAEFWILRGYREWRKLAPYQRARLAFSLAASFLGRGRGLSPLTPDESKENAEVAIAALKRMEEAVELAFRRGSNGGNPARLENGASKVQTNGSAGGAL